MPQTISIIVAVDEKNGIGRQNQLLKPISNDLKRFKSLTSGHPVIMGRSTWESLPNKPLPNRINIVLTRNADVEIEGALTANSIDAALEQCPQNNEVFVIGGAQIYSQFFKIADKIYLTKIHNTYDADAFFPLINDVNWQIESEELISDDEKAGVSYSFIDLKRK